MHAHNAKLATITPNLVPLFIGPLVYRQRLLDNLLAACAQGLRQLPFRSLLSATIMIAGVPLPEGVTTVQAAQPIKTVVLTGTQAPGENVGVHFDQFFGYEINNTGQVVFGGDLKSHLLSPLGIWAKIGDTIIPIAKEERQAPGMPMGVNFASLQLQADSGPFIDDLNQISFGGVLTTGFGVTESDRRGIWFGTASSLLPLYRSGTHAPGTPSEALFSGFSALAMNSAGSVAFVADLQVGAGGVDDANDRGIWLDDSSAGLGLIAREGSRPAGMSGRRFFESSQSLQPFSSIRISDDGKVAFLGKLSDEANGLWVGNSIGLDLVALGGEQAPDVPAGAIFVKDAILGNEQRKFGISPIGNLGFSSRLMEGSGGVTSDNWHGLWARISDDVLLVAREGSQAPGLAKRVVYSYSGSNPFDTASINDSGDLVFKAHVAGPGVTFSNDSAIWTGTLGNLLPVAQEGSYATGAPANFVFPDFSTTRPRINSLGQFAFAAAAEEVDTGVTRDGLWFYDPSAGLRLVAREGGQIEVAPGDLRTISTVGGSFDDAWAGQRNLSDSGELLFSARFTDGSQGLFTFTAPMTEPMTETSSTTLLLVCALVPLAALRRSRQFGR